MKKYKIGFFGGKFFPLHKGHLHCIEIGCNECEKFYLIIFINGKNEEDYVKIHGRPDYLTVENRLKQLERVKEKFDNLEIACIDVKDKRLPNEEEDWQAETPLVRKVVGNKLDVVYSSEVEYDDYFSKAYPEAVHRIINPSRNEVPISATKIRSMNEEERKKWII